MLAMEEWGHADDRVIQRQYSEKVCMSCAWFTYGIDAHCHTCVGCALMEALLLLFLRDALTGHCYVGSIN